MPSSTIDTYEVVDSRIRVRACVRDKRELRAGRARRTSAGRRSPSDRPCGRGAAPARWRRRQDSRARGSARAAASCGQLLRDRRGTRRARAAPVDAEHQVQDAPAFERLGNERIVHGDHSSAIRDQGSRIRAQASADCGSGIRDQPPSMARNSARAMAVAPQTFSPSMSK